MKNLKPLLAEIVVLTAVVGLIHNVALKLYWYWTVSWLDILMHFMGGALVGLVLLWLVFVSGRVSVIGVKHPHRIAFFVALAGALVVGLGWEVFEYYSGVFLTEDGIVFDTIVDLIMDSLGGVAAYWYVVRKKIVG